MRTCICHCRTCGRHFAGEEAFDRHRKGEFGVAKDSLEARYCANPECDGQDAEPPKPSWFEGVEGVCKVAEPDNPESGVTIWREKGGSARMRAGLAKATAGREPAHPDA
jgi:hypothetical protein